MTDKQLALSQWIKDKIYHSDYSVHDRLPTEAWLADRFHMSRYSVRCALASLEKEGFLRSVQGSGTYVSEKAAELLQKKAYADSQSNIIGLVLTNSRTHVFPDIIRGVSEQLSSEGWLLSLHITDNDIMRERRALESLLDRKPAGIILEPANSLLFPYNIPLYRSISGLMPLLMLHTSPSEICPVLSLNDREGVRMLVRHLIRNGHRKIGSILCLDEQTSGERYMGLLDELAANGIEPSDDLAVWIKRRNLHSLLSAPGNAEFQTLLDKATAVLCHDDRIAYELILSLNSMGIRVPEEISVVGYDDAIISNVAIPLTTVEHPKVQYGRNAAKAILHMVRDRSSFRITDYEVPPKLVLRSSVAVI